MDDAHVVARAIVVEVLHDRAARGNEAALIDWASIVGTPEDWARDAALGW